MKPARIKRRDLETLVDFARIGYWITRKWLRRVEDAGGDSEARAYVALQMKKQGYTPAASAAILGRAPVNNERSKQ